MEAREELLINYLGGCYLRLDREGESLRRKCTKVFNAILLLIRPSLKMFVSGPRLGEIFS